MLNFETYSCKQVFENFELYEKIKKVLLSQDISYVASFLYEELDVNCYFKDSDLIGFSLIQIAEDEPIAELCWFVIDKNKSNIIDSKWFLDRTLEYCKNKGVQSVKFNCDFKSWGKIYYSKEKLLGRFGYNINFNESDYDISIDL